jgi:hypothetical protein
MSWKMSIEFIRSKLVLTVLLVTIIFSLLLFIDFSPFLRGPGIYPPDWRWHYDFSVNLIKLLVPVLVILGILFLSVSKNLQKKEKVFLIIAIFLGLLLEFALLFYGRAGVGVLIHRITNLYINGYFTTSLGIDSVYHFMENFVAELETYPMYAKFHPPLAVLIFHFLNIFSKLTLSLFPFIENLNSSFGDVQNVWHGLKNYHKLTVLYSSVLIPVLSMLALIPLYFTSKLYYSRETAVKSVILFIFVPSVLMFIPLNDAFMPLFTAISLYFFIRALKMKSILDYFFSGLFLGIGIYFSLTFLPIILFYAILYLLNLKDKISAYEVKIGLSFLTGLITLPLILLIFFNFNSIDMFLKIMYFHEVAQGGRGYLIWLFYNLYDFFLFLGIPIFILIVGQFILAWKKIIKPDLFLVSFILFLLILNFTGSVRAEAARIWLPFVPLAILPAANFITEIKFSKRQFVIILLALGIQLIVFQSVLVTLY